MGAYTANGKRKSSMTHARRTHVCVCGKECRGNGGWSSHKKACAQYQAARAALLAQRGKHVDNAPKRPEWAKGVKVGDYLIVRLEYMTRGGQQGVVVSLDDKGVGLDFFCDADGDPEGAPSQEFWEWGEINPDCISASAEQPA